jgi:hypothetical protein
VRCSRICSRRLPVTTTVEGEHNPFPGTATGSAISAAVLIIPFGAVLFLVRYCKTTGGKNHPDSSVTISSKSVTHLTLAFHAEA